MVWAVFFATIHGLLFCILDFLETCFSCDTQGKLHLSGFLCLHQENRGKSLFCKDIIRFGTIGSEDNSGQWGPQEVSRATPWPEQAQPWGQTRAQGFILWGLENLQGGRQHHLPEPGPTGEKRLSLNSRLNLSSSCWCGCLSPSCQTPLWWSHPHPLDLLPGGIGTSNSHRSTAVVVWLHVELQSLLVVSHLCAYPGVRAFHLWYPSQGFSLLLYEQIALWFFMCIVTRPSHMPVTSLTLQHFCRETQFGYLYGSVVVLAWVQEKTYLWLDCWAFCLRSVACLSGASSA